MIGVVSLLSMNVVNIHFSLASLRFASLRVIAFENELGKLSEDGVAMFGDFS